MVSDNNSSICGAWFRVLGPKPAASRVGNALRVPAAQHVAGISWEFSLDGVGGRWRRPHCHTPGPTEIWLESLQDLRKHSPPRSDGNYLVYSMAFKTLGMADGNLMGRGQLEPKKLLGRDWPQDRTKSSSHETRSPFLLSWEGLGVRN